MKLTQALTLFLSSNAAAFSVNRQCGRRLFPPISFPTSRQASFLIRSSISDYIPCRDGGVGPDSDTEFLGSLCRGIAEGDVQPKFPPEYGRYVMYVIAGCPYAARPWTVLSFYGLNQGAIPIVKCFPASYDDGWFFEPISDGEKELVSMFPDALVDKDPVQGAHHLKQLYVRAKPNFKGAISVPLLWDTKLNTAVSNNSLELAEMIATQVRFLATRNKDVLLYPSRLDTPDLYEEHSKLVSMLHTKITTAVYKINATRDGKEHDKLIMEYYKTLDELQDRIAHHGPYLMGDHLRFADLVLFISLVRLDLAYQWRFGLGQKSIRDNYLGLLQYQRRIMALEGISETVFPRDIMALYFMTPKWVTGNGRTLPMVPESWKEAMTIEFEKSECNA